MKTHFDTIDEYMELKEKTREKIQKEINNCKDALNEKEDDGGEVFSHYRSEIDFTGDREGETISELIESADIESTEFNIGFEQGYLRGLEVALSIVKQ